MTVIAFPSPVLSDADERTISARVIASRYYSCRRVTDDDGRPTIVLLSRAGRTRGFVTKKHGVYAIKDARGTVVAESRKLDDILSVLLK